MRHVLPRPAGRFLAAALFSAALLALGACGDLASALPARPTPVPTLARLPSVTPVTPSATREPTPTLVPIITPTPVPLLASVAVAANVRAGPGTSFDVVGTLAADAEVRLLRRSADWYEIVGPDEVAGWMSGQVLTIDPATAAAVPAS